jgi:hypothetical protein
MLFGKEPYKNIDKPEDVQNLKNQKLEFPVDVPITAE